MQASRRAPGYDLFKLIVAILLLILFFLLNLRTAPQSPLPSFTLTAAASTSRARPSAVLSSAIRVSLTPSPAALPAPTATNLPESATSMIPATLTVAPLSSPTETSPAATTQSPLASPTETIIPEPAATPVPSSTATSTPSSPPSVASACEAASSRSRLQNGTNATIVRRLNFRSSPGIADNWLRTNLPGTRVEVVGGPQCLPHVAGAYVWWQIRLPDGQIGWSAEGSQFGTFYFMEPE